jgi:MFS transporter, NNP family, nitrate/nitrite transporter
MTDSFPSRKSRIALIGLLTGIFFVNFLSRIVLAPLMPVIEKDLGLSHAGAGGFFMMIAIGYSAGLFGSGFVSSVLKHRVAIVVATIALGCAFLVVVSSHTLWMIRLALFLLGVSTGIYLPSGLTTITTSISPENWGKAISVHELAPTLAYSAAPLIVEGLLIFCPWRGILLVIGGVSALLGLIFLRFSRGGDFRGEAPTLGNIRLLTGRPTFWIMTALFSLAIGATVGIYSMTPLYLVAEKGMDRSLANTLVGLSRIPVVVMAPLSGWISDRFGPKPTITVVTLVNGVTAILLGALSGWWVILMVFLQPILTVCFFPVGFTILSRIVPAPARSLSVALTIFIASLVGSGFIPTALGIFGDAGRFGLAFILIGVITLLSVFLINRIDLTEIKREGGIRE